MNYFKDQKKGLHRLLFLAVLVIILVMTIASSPFVSVQSLEAKGVPAVEWLRFQVPAAKQARFIEQDAAIWTPVLSNYPGFQSKEIWANPNSPDELIIITHWASFEHWQAIPKETLDRTTQRFQQAMGAAYVPESKAFRLAWHSRP